MFSCVKFSCALALPSVLVTSFVRADVDVTLFDADALAEEPTVVDCTLSTGETSSCARFVVRYRSAGLSIGPFCPETLDEVGGIWAWDGEDAGLYRLDRDFFERLAELGFAFADAEDKLHIADPAVGPPEVDNACLEAAENESVESTVLIPVSPVMADTPTDLGTVAQVGLALDGVPIFADAPSVLETGHLPALDPCGGHVDPGGWYHWHATATDMETVYAATEVDAECALEQTASAHFGYAFDGYAMLGSHDADGSVPSDLDACNGHVGPSPASAEDEYHYHATADFPNLPPCLSGVVAEDNFATTASGGIGAAGGGGGGPGAGADGMPPGMAEAAASLGVTEEALVDALSEAGGPDRLDADAAAASLGITGEALRAVLPGSPGN